METLTLTVETVMTEPEPLPVQQAFAAMNKNLVITMNADSLPHTLPTADIAEDMAEDIADDMDDPMADPDSPSELYENDSQPGSDESREDHFSDDEEEQEELEVEHEESEADFDGDNNENGGVPIQDHEIPLIGAAPQPTPTAPSTTSDLLSTTNAPHHPSIHVPKPTPYIPDPGHLLITDPNPLSPSPTEALLTLTARDAAQSLLNHLLTVCPIRRTATSSIEMTLPAPIFQLPREKAIPVPKAPTKWEVFAKKKGIGKGRQDGVDKGTGERRAGKMVYDEGKGEWVPKWGYKGRNTDGEGEWLVEIDEKAEKRKREAGSGGAAGKVSGGKGTAGKVSSGNGGTGAGDDPRGLKRVERKERVKRNERAQRVNERKGRVGKN